MMLIAQIGATAVGLSFVAWLNVTEIRLILATVRHTLAVVHG